MTKKGTNSQKKKKIKQETSQQEWVKESKRDSERKIWQFEKSLGGAGPFGFIFWLYKSRNLTTDIDEIVTVLPPVCVENAPKYSTSTPQSPRPHSDPTPSLARIGELGWSCCRMFLKGDRRYGSSETDNGGTTPRTKIYIYTLSCQWGVLWSDGFLLHFYQSFSIVWSRKWCHYPPKKSCFSSYKSKISSVTAVWWRRPCEMEAFGELGVGAWYGRTVCSIYMCSPTLFYLLFTRSVHMVHPQISMVRSVAQSRTVMWRWRVSLKEEATDIWSGRDTKQ